MNRTERIIVGGLMVLGVSDAALAQQPTVTFQDASTTVAIVNVSLIPMDRERVEPGQAIVIQGGRIAAIGAVGQVPVPNGAMIVDGSGRYLVPGRRQAQS